jgi:hypothetical protein
MRLAAARLAGPRNYWLFEHCATVNEFVAEREAKTFPATALGELTKEHLPCTGLPKICQGSDWIFCKRSFNLYFRGP